MDTKIICIEHAIATFYKECTARCKPSPAMTETPAKAPASPAFRIFTLHVLLAVLAPNCSAEVLVQKFLQYSEWSPSSQVQAPTRRTRQRDKTDVGLQFFDKKCLNPKAGFTAPSHSTTGFRSERGQGGRRLTAVTKFKNWGAHSLEWRSFLLWQVYKGSNARLY